MNGNTRRRTRATPNGRQITLAPKEAHRLFQVSSELADVLEGILESRGSYRADFLNGLKRSIHQAKSGKTKKIRSLAELK